MKISELAAKIDYVFDDAPGIAAMIDGIRYTRDTYLSHPDEVEFLAMVVPEGSLWLIYYRGYTIGENFDSLASEEGLINMGYCDKQMQHYNAECSECALVNWISSILNVDQRLLDCDLSAIADVKRVIDTYVRQKAIFDEVMTQCATGQVIVKPAIRK